MTTLFPLWLWSSLFILITVGGSVFIHTRLLRLLPEGILRRHHDVSAAIYAIVGILHSLILGFLLITSQERLELVRHATMEEASLTVELAKVAEGLQDSVALAIRKEVIEYTKGVIGPEWSLLEQKVHLQGLPRILEGMFTTVVETKPGNYHEQNIHSQCLSLLERITSQREVRIHASSEHLHGLFAALIVVGALCLIGGVMIFTHDSKLILLGFTAAVALTVSLVIILIIVLDAPITNGLLTTEPFEHALEILQSMK